MRPFSACLALVLIIASSFSARAAPATRVRAAVIGIAVADGKTYVLVSREVIGGETRVSLHVDGESLPLPLRYAHRMLVVPQPGAPPAVYVTGQDLAGRSGYLVDDRFVVLDGAWCYGIAVAGRDVWVSGSGPWRFHAEQPPCLWKNGVRIDLPVPPGARTSYANDVAVDGATVVAAGQYLADKRELRACTWKNGVRTELGPGSAVAVALRQGVVHAAGVVPGGPGRGNHACLWVDGQRTMLGFGLASAATSLLLVPRADGGAAALVGGFVRDADGWRAGWWRDGTFRQLPGPFGRGAHVAALAVAGERLLLAGADAAEAACWWDGAKKVAVDVGR